MSVARLRAGELLAGLGLVGLFVMLLLVWFQPETGAVSGSPGVSIPPEAQSLVNGRADAFRDAVEQTGWTSLGWFAVILVVAGMIVCAAWLIATLVEPSPALPVALQVWSLVSGVVLALVILLRLLFPPELSYGVDPDTQLPGLLGLVFAILIAVGAFLSTKDERTGAAESQPGEIELRRVPPPVA